MSGLVNRNDYCQFLLVSQTNYTLTYFAKHSQRFSHDAPTRYLKRDRIKPNQIWQHSKQEIVISPNGYLIFDDSVLDKNHSREIALVHRQFSGNSAAMNTVSSEGLGWSIACMSTLNSRNSG